MARKMNKVSKFHTPFAYEAEMRSMYSAILDGDSSRVDEFVNLFSSYAGSLKTSVLISEIADHGLTFVGDENTGFQCFDLEGDIFNRGDIAYYLEKMVYQGLGIA